MNATATAANLMTSLLTATQHHADNIDNHPADMADFTADVASPVAVWWKSASVVLLALLYTIVIGSGVIGNASLLLTVCSQTSARFRNPLLVALCVADLMVTGVAAPLTLLTILSTQQRWSMTALECKCLYFMQVRFATEVHTHTHTHSVH